MSSQVGEVVVPTKSDFDNFVNLATDHNGWTRNYSSKSKSLPITTYTKVVEGNDIRAAKVNILIPRFFVKQLG